MYVQDDIFEVVDFVLGDFVSGDLVNGDFALFYLGDCLIIGVSSQYRLFGRKRHGIEINLVLNVCIIGF